MRIPKSSVPLGENPALSTYSRQTQGRATGSPCQARQHFPCPSSGAHSASRGVFAQVWPEPSHRAGRNISAPTFSTLSFQSSNVKPGLAIYSVLPHISPEPGWAAPAAFFLLLERPLLRAHHVEMSPGGTLLLMFPPSVVTFQAALLREGEIGF